MLWNAKQLGADRRSLIHMLAVKGNSHRYTTHGGKNPKNWKGLSNSVLGSPDHSGCAFGKKPSLLWPWSFHFQTKGSSSSQQISLKIQDCCDELNIRNDLGNHVAAFSNFWDKLKIQIQPVAKETAL